MDEYKSLTHLQSQTHEKAAKSLIFTGHEKYISNKNNWIGF